jgi:hypothetical protein
VGSEAIVALFFLALPLPSLLGSYLLRFPPGPLPWRVSSVRERSIVVTLH